MAISQHEISLDFGKALKRARQATGVTQEQFDAVSSRTYVSAIERGLKSPTLNKVEQLAAVLGLHPVTLVAMAYVRSSDTSNSDMLLNRVTTEVRNIMSSTSGF